jgi:hypothetical protein
MLCRNASTGGRKGCNKTSRQAAAVIKARSASEEVPTAPRWRFLMSRERCERRVAGIPPVFAGWLLPRSGSITQPSIDAQRLRWVRGSDKPQTPIGVSSAAAATPTGLGLKFWLFSRGSRCAATLGSKILPLWGKPSGSTARFRRGGVDFPHVLACRFHCWRNIKTGASGFFRAAKKSCHAGTNRSANEFLTKR